MPLDPSKYIKRTVTVKDEGASQGEVTSLNFTGSGVSATVSGSDATIDIAGGGASPDWGDIGGTLGNQTDLQAALDAKSDTTHTHTGVYEPANANIQSHISSTSNPHSVTKSQVSLGNADNTSDANKPVSTAQQTALDLKANLAGGTFSGDISVPDEVYGSGWNGSLEVPTKNAVYDKIETIGGYTLQTAATSFNPADGTTYYFGSLLGTGPFTSVDNTRLYIPKTGTIKAIYVFFNVGGTLASSETSTIYLRLNNTTDTIISSSVTLTTALNPYSNLALSISVSAGDYFEIKWVAPTFATNPAAVRISAIIYIE